MPKKETKTHEEKVSEEYFPVDEDDLRHTTEKIMRGSPDLESVKRITEKLEGEIVDKPRLSVEKVYSKPGYKDLETVESLGKVGRSKSTHRFPRDDSKGTSVYPKLRNTGAKKIVRKKTTRKKVTSSSGSSKILNAGGKKSVVDYKPLKISLKKDGYELVITEKPQAALKIASALGNVKKRDLKKVPYYEVDRDGESIVVACAVGHLFTLKQNVAGSSVPVFDISWVPNYLALKKDFTKRYYDTLLKLAKDAGSVTVATDFDIEGEVIGMNIVRYICGQKDANRMKFSTLTSKELNDAYENKLPSLEWGQAIAGETRHYLDWFYGINLSRALMNAIKTTGKFQIMSIGRVQGPALNLIVKKEREIQDFKSETYWQVFIKLENFEKVELKYIKDIFDLKELVKFENIVGKIASAETKKTEQILPPNVPFDLTTLQTEAYKFYGISPSNTLRVAQSLYLAGLISYPRTSSQKLPDSIDYKTILKKLANEYNVEHLIKKSKPLEGKKTDPAHPSIHPTGEKQILSGDEEKIYNLIVRRFLSLFCEDAIIGNKKILVTVNNVISHEQKIKGRLSEGNRRCPRIDNKKIIAEMDDLTFTRRGSSIRKKAWLEIYPSKMKEEEIPDINGKFKIVDSRTEEKETQPPKRYSPASIISVLEKKNLGTKSTRSSILETLYDRGYVKEKSIQATPLGMSLIATLEKYSPIIIDEKLTRDFEKEIEVIGNAKKNWKNREDKVIEKAKKTITDIAGDFEKYDTKIGQELVGAQAELRALEKIENTLVQCPKCKKGNLAITYSRKTRRHFIACDAYPECKNTFSLPPNGVIKKAGKVCEECGFPTLMRISKGKRPWVFCFNPECKTNQERIEEYKKKQEENN